MLDVELAGGVYRVTLRRPDVRNAFNAELIAALRAAFDTRPEEARAVLLAGEGKAFCGGGDLNWMRAQGEKTEIENAADALELARLYEAVDTCPVPVVARIQGAAFGGGLGLVAASDIAIAATDALFAFSEVRLGLAPATISPFVVRKIGTSAARALFVTGEAFGADEALRIGLVHSVVAPEDLDAEVSRKLGLILSAGPDAVRVAKRLAQSPPTDLEKAAQVLARVRASAEAREGIQAFLEKRRAPFAEETSA